MVQEVGVNTWNQAAERYIVYNASVNESGMKWDGGWEGEVMGNSGKLVSAVAGCELCQEEEPKPVESHLDLTGSGVKIKGCTCSTELGGVGEGP